MECELQTFCYKHRVPAAPGKTYCQPCLDYQKARRDLRKARGICVYCPEDASVGRATCVSCSELRKRIVSQAKNNGMCQRHPAVAAATNSTVCQVCLDRGNNRTQKVKLAGMCTSHPAVAAVAGRTKCQACLDYIKNYGSLRRKKDPNFKLRTNIRSRLTSFFRTISSELSNTGTKQVSAIRDLGCTTEELVRHFESKFTPGMSWENYGLWHVDHIKALATFDMADPKQRKMAVHYTNLQPLWAKDNLSKGKRG